MIEPDWVALVDAALGDANREPRPEQLAHYLDRWAQAFARAEGGPPLQADFPEPVQEFFVRIAVASNLGGRPCKGDTDAIAARAWIRHFYRDLYEGNLEMARLCKELGIPYNGRKLDHETPSTAVIEDLADNAPYGVERIRQIIKKRGK